MLKNRSVFSKLFEKIVRSVNNDFHVILLLFFLLNDNIVHKKIRSFTKTMPISSRGRNFRNSEKNMSLSPWKELLFGPSDVQCTKSWFVFEGFYNFKGSAKIWEKKSYTMLNFEPVRYNMQKTNQTTKNNRI